MGVKARICLVLSAVMMTVNKSLSKVKTWFKFKIFTETFGETICCGAIVAVNEKGAAMD